MPEITEKNLTDIPLEGFVYAVTTVNGERTAVCGFVNGHDGFYANGALFPPSRSVHGHKIKPGDSYIGD